MTFQLAFNLAAIAAFVTLATQALCRHHEQREAGPSTLAQQVDAVHSITVHQSADGTLMLEASRQATVEIAHELFEGALRELDADGMLVAVHA